MCALSVKPCRACHLSQRERQEHCRKLSLCAQYFSIEVDGLALPLGELARERLRGRELTACALSVKPFGLATSPKGRGKSTAGSFLFVPNTLASRLTAWLSLWESWRGSA